MAPRLTRSTASLSNLPAASTSTSSNPPAASTSKPTRKGKGRKTANSGGRAGSSSRAPSVVRADSVPPVDRLTLLSSELLSLILHHLSPPSAPDLSSLSSLALVSSALLPHVRLHLYRELKVDTRTNAHTMHRTVHGTLDINKNVKAITADVSSMSKTSSQWLGWFLFHSMHSLCGIIGSCRTVLTVTLYLPSEAAAWTQSLCASLNDLRFLHTLTKDLERSKMDGVGSGAGKREGMDIGWRPRKSVAMWSVSQFLKPLSTMKSLHTLRLCGISSDSSTTPPLLQHTCRLKEVVLVEVNITNTDLLQILGNPTYLTSLTMWRSSLLSKKGLTHVLKRCTNLVELRIGGSWFGAKDDDDTVHPLDLSIASLPQLRLVHCHGSLISPSILLQTSTNLDHLLVVGSVSFTPEAIHTALARMRSEPAPSVRKLTLPEIGWTEGVANSPDGGWTDGWKFAIKQLADAKGVKLEDGKKIAHVVEGNDSGAE